MEGKNVNISQLSFYFIIERGAGLWKAHGHHVGSSAVQFEHQTKQLK